MCTDTYINCLHTCVVIVYIQRQDGGGDTFIDNIHILNIVKHFMNLILYDAII